MHIAMEMQVQAVCGGSEKLGLALSEQKTQASMLSSLVAEREGEMQRAREEHERELREREGEMQRLREEYERELREKQDGRNEQHERELREREGEMQRLREEYERQLREKQDGSNESNFQTQQRFQSQSCRILLLLRRNFQSVGQ